MNDDAERFRVGNTQAWAARAQELTAQIELLQAEVGRREKAMELCGGPCRDLYADSLPTKDCKHRRRIKAPGYPAVCEECGENVTEKNTPQEPCNQCKGTMTCTFPNCEEFPEKGNSLCTHCGERPADEGYKPLCKRCYMGHCGHLPEKDND